MTLTRSFRPPNAINALAVACELLITLRAQLFASLMTSERIAGEKCSSISMSFSAQIRGRRTHGCAKALRTKAFCEKATVTSKRRRA